MERDYQNSTNFDDRCDHAVAKIYLGQYQEAVELFKQLEKEKPGEYSVAANLGTAYELCGKNEDALKWIKEGMQRNHFSHHGTEWLHAKILEAKIAGESYFSQHQTVLGLDAKTMGNSISVDAQTYTAKEVAEAIQYQLRERVQFVKPKDQVVAALLFDYAAVEAATTTLESAQKLLTLSAEYGYPMDKIQPLMKQYDKKILWRKTKQRGMYVLLAMVVIGGLWYLHKRGIFVLSSKDLNRKRVG